MKTILKQLTALFTEAIQNAFPSVEGIFAEVTQSTRLQFGHYQCNSALKLAKEVGASPRQVAEQLMNALPATDWIERLEIAGPGFINITIKAHLLSERLTAALHDSHLGVEQAPQGVRVVIDFSSPNIAKEMHVGHLRSTIIGDALARILAFLGYGVVRLNHVGDWGTSFGMLIAYLKRERPGVLDGSEATDLSHLVEWYRAAKGEFDLDPGFKRESQLEVVALQSGEPVARAAWRTICEISRRGFQEIYQLLDIELEERGESFYNDQLASIVADFEQKGLLTLSNGAQCIFLDGYWNREGEPLPLMIQKADGGYNYATTDLAALRHRIEVERGDWLIYVTDSGQATHFSMVFQAAEKGGYLDRGRVRIDHVPFGLVLGTDGKKFRTREGDTERLIDLLNAAIDHARALLSERVEGIGEAELDRSAHILGIDAVKYADLSCNRTGDYLFSYERMLSLEGNTAAFLLYAYVRIMGIKRKVGVEIDLSRKIELSHPSEILLGLHLCQFGEALESTADDLLPNRLADYLYTLAEKFHHFFRDCRVEGAPEQAERLLLCEVTGRTLATGLGLLGLKTLDRM